jgi:hypothetical protein
MTDAQQHEAEPIAAYKSILTGIIDNRPSGTRQRLAAALGKHRSFVTQITSPAYTTPLPARHLGTIFQVCHFNKEEEDRFLSAYQHAHPGKLPEVPGADGMRQLTLTVPDLGDGKKNRELDDAIEAFVTRIAVLARGGIP